MRLKLVLGSVSVRTLFLWILMPGNLVRCRCVVVMMCLSVLT